MWFIFLISCIAVALAALGVVWIGSKIFHSIEQQDKEIEKETYERMKKEIKEELEKEKRE